MWNSTTSFEPGVVAWAVVVTVTLVAAVIDARSHRIANRITGPLLLGGLIWSFINGGFSGLGWSVLATVIVAMPYFLLWLHTGGGSGAADAKMMGAVAAWLGLGVGIQFLLAAAIAGGILALISALIRGHLIAALTNTFGMSAMWMFQLVTNPASVVQARSTPAYTASAKVPYGVAIFAGVCGVAARRFLCAH
jgi:prepilin peptidase CpaA